MLLILTGLPKYITPVDREKEDAMHISISCNTPILFNVPEL
jgi:hypothetical protein